MCTGVVKVVEQLPSSRPYAQIPVLQKEKGLVQEKKHKSIKTESNKHSFWDPKINQLRLWIPG
jgi:hypothetical protein